MVDKAGIIPYGWSDNLPLRQLVYKVESYLCVRGVKDDNDKKKDEKNKTEENLPRMRKIRIHISKVMVERNSPNMVLLD